jgi:lysophospholipase L1-like esterase
MRLSRLAFVLLALSILAGCARHRAAEAAADLAPRKNWRLIPQAIHASMNADDLAPLKDGKSCTWNASFPGQPWFALRLPERRKGPAMVTFEYREQPTNASLLVEVSSDSTNGFDGNWTQLADPRRLGTRLDKAIVEADQGPWVRLQLLRIDKSLVPAELKIINIGAYQLDPAGRNDYWVALGASIQAQSLRQEVFHAMVTERFPEYDPVLFNTAVGGWTSANLLANLPRIIDEHPHARYMTIHIGGNNVSRDRPYPGGAGELRDDLIAILSLIQEAGKIPILSRLSYRAYRETATRPGVPPEENGSGPYVTAIFDPLIMQYCPLFYDWENARGMVDAYGWFREHQDELSPDGVHVNPKGQASWNRLWAEHAGGVIYGAR